MLLLPLGYNTCIADGGLRANNVPGVSLRTMLDMDMEMEKRTQIKKGEIHGAWIGD